jgi:hypothetical protein
MYSLRCSFTSSSMCRRRRWRNRLSSWALLAHSTRSHRSAPTPMVGDVTIHASFPMRDTAQSSRGLPRLAVHMDITRVGRIPARAAVVWHPVHMVGRHSRLCMTYVLPWQGGRGKQGNRRVPLYAQTKTLSTTTCGLTASQTNKRFVRSKRKQTNDMDLPSRLCGASKARKGGTRYDTGTVRQCQVKGSGRVIRPSLLLSPLGRGKQRRYNSSWACSLLIACQVKGSGRVIRPSLLLSPLGRGKQRRYNSSWACSLLIAFNLLGL